MAIRTQRELDDVLKESAKRVRAIQEAARAANVQDVAEVTRRYSGDTAPQPRSPKPSP